MYKRQGGTPPPPSRSSAQPKAATPNAARLARGAGKTVPASGPREWRFGLRILPVTAFIAALVLTVKVGGIWDAWDQLLSAVEVGTAAEATAAGSTAVDAGSPVQLAAADQPAGGDEKLDPFALGKSQICLLYTSPSPRD